MNNKKITLAMLLGSGSFTFVDAASAQVAPASLWGLEAISEEVGSAPPLAKSETLPVALPEVAFGGSEVASGAESENERQATSQHKSVAVAPNDLWGLSVMAPSPREAGQRFADNAILPEIRTIAGNAVAAGPDLEPKVMTSEASGSQRMATPVAHAEWPMPEFAMRTPPATEPIVPSEVQKTSAAREQSLRPADRVRLLDLPFDDAAAVVTRDDQTAQEHARAPEVVMAVKPALPGPPSARHTAPPKPYWLARFLAGFERDIEDDPRRASSSSKANATVMMGERASAVSAVSPKTTFTAGQALLGPTFGQQTSRPLPSWLKRFLEGSRPIIDTDEDGEVEIYSQGAITASATGDADFAAGALRLASPEAKGEALSAAVEEDREDNPMIDVWPAVILTGASAHAAASHAQDSNTAIASSSRIASSAPAQQAKSHRSSPDKQAPGQDPAKRLAFLIPDDWRLRPRKGLFE
jgi:hypothetical protein